MNSDFVPATYATIAGLVVGIFVKVMGSILDKRKNALDEHLALRKELREELDSVKEELQDLRLELDEWRNKYYMQVELTNALKVDILQLTEELEEYKRISGIYPTDISKDNGWTKSDEYLK
jgi:uncharacterized membrane-anchored protein YhcB (DUF1043 family)